MKGTMYPSGGAGASSPPGMSHSIAMVLARRIPRLTRLSMCGQVKSEQYHIHGSESGGARALLAVKEQEQETLSAGGDGAEKARLRLDVYL
jgi:hypothetical protein